MARASKMSVLKRKREREKAEKAARKREQRERGEVPEAEGGGNAEATQEDLEGYGVLVGPDDDDDER